MLFWIFTPLPTTAAEPMTTFWPIEQFSPIVAPFMMWEKCQIFVPLPIVQGWST